MLGLRTRAPEDSPAAPFDSRQPPRTPTPSSSRRAVTVVLALGLTLLWAWLATIALDASNFPDSLTVLRNRPLAAAGLWPSLAVVWVVVLLILALVGRLWLTLGIVTALTAVLGFANTNKLDLRNDPLYPSDVIFLRQPGFLAEMVPPRSLLLALGGLVVLVAGAWLVGRLVARLLPPLSRGASRRGLVVLRATRALVVVICLVLLWVAGNFNQAGNPWRAAYDSTGLRWRPWDEKVNYQKNGFVAGLLFNTHITAMEKPRGYSQAAVEKVAERYRAEAASMNRGRTGSLDGTNVIAVLSEAFSSPTWLKTVTFPRDPIPKTTALMDQTVSGKMLAPGFGGGTANVEFELLTGQSLSQFSPQLSTPYDQLVPKEKSYPSAVEWFERRGHEALALHPFSPRMYSRPEVYDEFGFKRFITKDQMKHKERLGGRYISDQAAFEETLDTIKSESKPLLMHVITMQNHLPYGGQYDDPITPTGIAPQYAKLAGQYARGIARTDDAFADFLAKLKKQKEPTAVIFYGDHLPGQVYPPDLVKREGLLTAHQTPFVIWSNTTKLEHADLPTTSPIQFMPTLFDALDVPVPPMYALLDALDQQVPAIDTGFAVNAQNQRVARHDLGPEAKQVLADYRMIQYDLSIGGHYSEKVMFGDAPTG